MTCGARLPLGFDTDVRSGSNCDIPAQMNHVCFDPNIGSWSGWRAFRVSIAQSFCRLRNGGTQVIRVEKIEVSNTAQAIVGNPNPSAS